MKSGCQATDASSDGHRVHAVVADRALAARAIWQPYTGGVPTGQAVADTSTPRACWFSCCLHSRLLASPVHSKAKHRASAIAVESVAVA